jgi:hypothetical protein
MLSKLAVLMLSLWKSQIPYQPFPKPLKRNDFPEEDG